MIVGRNRLIALFTRMVLFTAFLTSLIFYGQKLGNSYTVFCLFETQIGMVYLIVLGFVILLNTIDLRHGIKGISPGLYRPFALSFVSYGILGGIMGIAYVMPTHNFFCLEGLFYNLLLILVPTLDWIFFEKKGVVKFYSGITWVIYPVFFMVFTVFRAVIWNSAPLFPDGSMYAYEFFSHRDPLFLLYAVAMLFINYGFSMLVIWTDKLLGRPFIAHKDILLD